MVTDPVREDQTPPPQDDVVTTPIPHAPADSPACQMPEQPPLSGTPETLAVEVASSEESPSSNELPATTESPSAAENPPLADNPSPTADSDGCAAPHATQGEEDTTSAKPRKKLQLNPTYVPRPLAPVPNLQGSTPPAVEPPPRAEQIPAASIEDRPAQDPPPHAESASQVSTDQQAEEIVATAPPPSVPPPGPVKPVEIPRSAELDHELESQLAAAMSSSAAASPPTPAAPVSQEESDTTATPSEPVTEESVSEGMSLTGQVLSIHGDDVFLMFPGFQRNGLLSLRQFGERPPTVGQWIQTRVVKVDEENRLIIVSLPRGLAKVSGDWKALSAGQVVDCMVVKTNKGGLDVNVGSLRGFLPAGQVDLGYVADLDGYVGQKLRVRVTEVNPARRRLVVSRRQLLIEERDHLEQEMYEKIAPGQTVTGRVKTIKDYGAFVDIGGVDGLLHVAQISWQRVNHPSEVLQEGQEIEVQILSVDRDKKKVGLGMRQLQRNPWKDAENEFPKGKNVTGRVTRTESFGAFVELAQGVEGLVHISELDHRRVGKVTDVVKVGDTVEAQILEVDPKRKRISLSIKSLLAKPEPEPTPEQPAAPAYVRQRKGDLKGGMGGPSKGGLFGNPGDYG